MRPASLLPMLLPIYDWPRPVYGILHSAIDGPISVVPSIGGRTLISVSVDGGVSVVPSVGGRTEVHP